MSDGEAWVTPREALDVARHWDAGATEIVHLRAGENCTWLVEALLEDEVPFEGRTQR